MNLQTKHRLQRVYTVTVLLLLLLNLTAQPAYLQSQTPMPEPVVLADPPEPAIPAGPPEPVVLVDPPEPVVPADPPEAVALANPPQAVVPLDPQTGPEGEIGAQAIDCNNPPSGRQARLRAEAEIALVHRWEDSNDRLRYSTIDLLNTGLYQAVYQTYDYSPYTNIRSPSVATADLAGDGAPETVIAFRNVNEDLAVRVRQTADYWYSGNEARHSDNLEFIDVAAGDLDRKDGDDEVVIAFEDLYNDLHLVGLNGDSTGRIASVDNAYSWSWYGDYSGMGDVSQVAVATGDLDTDGYDDEVVVAFVDGNCDLQVRFFEVPAFSSTSTRFWNFYAMSWTNAGRGSLCSLHDTSARLLDVTTGDVDGDFQDEVILGFRDGADSGRNDNGRMQVLILDRTEDPTTPGLDWAFDDSTYLQINSEFNYSLNLLDYVAPRSAAIAAADIDADGKDEIVLAYALYVRQGAADDNKHTYPHLFAWDYTGLGPGGLSERAHATTKSSPWDHVSLMNVATGDIDMDAKAEIVQAFRDENGNVQVWAWDGESGLAQSRSYTLSNEPVDLGELALAVGDTNGDSSLANYTGVCYEAQEVQVTSVLHAAPNYSAYNRDSGSNGSCAAFGKFVGGGIAGETSAETTLGASVKIDMSVDFGVAEVGPSFSYEFEQSIETSNEEATMRTDGLRTATDASVGIYDLVTYDRVTYWVYEYRESRSGTSMPLRIPKGYVPSSLRLDLWYSQGPALFGSSWVPVGQNLARGGTATQSSTGWEGYPSRAVDGNADGNYAGGSVTHTGYDQYAWWQVDLGRVQWLDAVQVWNRTDYAPYRLTNFYVFVSDTPFASNSPTVLLSDPKVWNTHITGTGGRPTIVTPNRSGRYLRVQLAGTNYLSLAEVQVWGHPGEVKDAAGNRQFPTARPVAVDGNSFRVTLPNGASQLVNGKLLWTWSATNGIQVDRGAGPASWETQEDTTWTSSTTTTTAQTVGVGFEVKVAGAGVEGEVTYGSATRTSRALSWSQGTVVEGQAGPLVWETTPVGYSYNYSPYLWVQKAMSTSGVPQEFMVLDYWVASIGPLGVLETEVPAATVGITPTVPVIASPSHPDPDTWYPDSTVVLTWTQPSGDPAVVAGYRWYMDSAPDTVPGELNKGLITTHTYTDVADGLWYAHVRAMSDEWQWSDTGHHAVRVDANPPQVKLALNPSQPTGNSGWYKTPLTVTVQANDGAGSGVDVVELSTDDGATWQPYAPLVYDADTPTTTIWARATDAVGHTSDPVSATFKIDVTPPSSKIEYGGYTFGVWVANVVTDTLGNQHLVLGGVIDDSLSGRAGMGIQADGGDWTSANAIGVWHPFASQPQIEVNWYYTATTELGRGNHVFYGQAQDEAGNLEEPYEIAQVIWFPPSTPDLSASTVAVSPQVARPGDEVTFVIDVRNSGRQEAQVAFVDTLPAGLTPITDTLGYDVSYDPDAGTITWPARLLWPGQWSRVSFTARVDAGGATVLENQVTAHAFWPNTDALPDPARQYFLDREDTVVMTATVTVDPDLPLDADVIPPQVNVGVANGAQVTAQREVELEVWADPDARWMFLREWTPDPLSGDWTVAQESGWISCVPTMTWTLSPGDGVKYLGIWVADGAGNVSLLDQHNLTYINLVGNEQNLPAGGRTQYRFEMDGGDLAAFYATALSGDPDLYMWKPLQTFRPNTYSNGPSGVDEEVIEWLDESGLYLLEVEAVGESAYQLTIADESLLAIENRVSQAHLLSFDEKDRPAHPLTISDPLSAGSAGSPVWQLPHRIYLPLITKEG